LPNFFATILITILLLSQSCTNTQPSAQTPINADSLDGLWINQTYIDLLATKQTAKFIQSHKLTELYLNFKNNYAYVLDGDWEPKKYQLYKIKDSIYIYENKKDSALKIKIYNHQLIAKNDSGYIYTLKRPKEENIIDGFEFKTALRKTANNILVEGKWKVSLGPRNLMNKQINFNKDGSMSGLNQLSLYYEICLTGECKRYCDETDLIYMSPKANEPGGYWHSFTRKGNTITIWKVKSLEWMSDWPDIQPETHWLTLTKIE
jgi:hypothetical protein